MKPWQVRLGNLIGWLLVPMAALMQLVRLQRPLFGPHLPTPELLGFVVLTLVALPWVIKRRGELTGRSFLVIGSFALLVAWGALTTVLHPASSVETDVVHVVPWFILGYPLATALFAMTAALGMVMAAEPGLRVRVFVVAGAAMLAAGAVSWPSQVEIHRSWRFATGMAGSATIHLVLLLVAAVAVGWYLEDRRRWFGLVVGILAMAAFLATGSRAGFVALVVFAAVLGAMGWRSKLGRGVLVGGAALVGAVLVSFAMFPELRRMLEFTDTKRAINLASAMQGWLSSLQSTVFGTGYGQVWPWYVFESGYLASPGTGLIGTPYGEVLLSPHSTLLAVVAELGLVGLVFLTATLLPVFWFLDGGPDRPGNLVMVAALIATLTCFLFDTYLLKNFGVSFWWWAVVALCALGGLRNERGKSLA